jgi:rhodanese-related sulfurtransferase
MDTLLEHARPTPHGYRDLAPSEVRALMTRAAPRAARVVDVREPAELVSELGHIEGVEAAPLGTLEHAAKGWRRDEPIVLVCRSGARSGRAAMALASLGFARVFNMVGGMMAWNAEGLPVVR